MCANAHKLVRVRQDTLTRAQYDDRVILGNVLEQLIAVLFAPLFVRHGFKRAFEVPLNIPSVEGVIDLRLFLVFLFVKIMPKCKIQAGFAYVRFIVW